MRLDKLLCEMKIGTRSQVKTYIRQGFVTVNGMPVKQSDLKIEEASDKIVFRGNILHYRKFFYYMLNKPPGTVSATRDKLAPTVIALLGDEYREDIFPVGRLDRDTTGLLVLTNDGALAHQLLAPGKHVDKTYHVTLEKKLSGEAAYMLEQGVDIGDEKPTLPAHVQILSDNAILLTIHEGRYHQVKRMLAAVGNHVLSLKRTTFGSLELDGSLKPGQFRELTEAEINSLKECVGKCTK
ncbi:MAG: rRNA pseudouridine synthase [Lachnospiraceae bacterium]|nr:rRNA pseudouridine synthase [Lachnospiraceae bacterium]